MKRRALSLLLALVLLVSAFPVNVRAAENESKQIVRKVIPEASAEDVELPDASGYYTNVTNAGASIRSALKNARGTSRSSTESPAVQ